VLYRAIPSAIPHPLVIQSVPNRANRLTLLIFDPWLRNHEPISFSGRLFNKSVQFVSFGHS
jgi:hypothetical protein